MKILFQGDSITDAGRSRENDLMLGVGYPLLVKGNLGLEEPNKYEFYNRGIGGNRIVDVYARIKADILNIKPDVMSILVGINDVWHEKYENPNGVDSNKFFKIYSMLIEEIKAELPDVKIMILEPFFLEGSATKENLEYFKQEVPKRAEMAKKVAENHDLMFVPLQEKFNDLLETATPEYWLEDGVHPTAAGHELIKNEWIKAFKSL